VEIESGEDIDPTNTGETITVTGSRIRRPNLESNIPVTSVGVEELLDDGSLSLGDALNDLPSLRSTFSTANSQRFIGTTGLSLLDLRGLGTSRTLVLVNGRRHVTSQAGEFTVDVNTIPFELLQRVDVVTGGSSAVYGSDAIAGVVNFVLRRDYEGISLRGQGGISERGDRGRIFRVGNGRSEFLRRPCQHRRGGGIFHIQGRVEHRPPGAVRCVQRVHQLHPDGHGYRPRD
jgi:outer membrane receptor protein involved in Fe transport